MFVGKCALIFVIDVLEDYKVCNRNCLMISQIVIVYSILFWIFYVFLQEAVDKLINTTVKLAEADVLDNLEVFFTNL